MELLQRTCHFERMNIERVAARGFVLVGGVIWVSAVFGAWWGYRAQTVWSSATAAAIPLAITIVVFLLGWFYEMLAAVLLLLGAGGLVVAGLIMQWETGVWGQMSVYLIGPMVVAGLLFLLAARMQRVCELEEEAKK